MIHKHQSDLIDALRYAYGEILNDDMMGRQRKPEPCPYCTKTPHIRTLLGKPHRVLVQCGACKSKMEIDSDELVGIPVDALDSICKLRAFTIGVWDTRCIAIRTGNPGRATGKTTKQMLYAPKNATVVWCGRDLSYPREVAKRIGRQDLIIVSSGWLKNMRYTIPGRTHTGIVFDHALEITATDYNNLREASIKLTGSDGRVRNADFRFRDGALVCVPAEPRYTKVSGSHETSDNLRQFLDTINRIAADARKEKEMKTTLEATASNFDVPEVVKFAVDGGPAFALPVQRVDAEVLERLCDTFKKNLFALAQKVPPERAVAASVSVSDHRRIVEEEKSKSERAAYDSIRRIILDDNLAAEVQTLGQYRTAIINGMR